MPKRLLRDWTDSERMALLSAEAEALFARIIMKADDWGVFYGDPARLLAYCFPLRRAVTFIDDMDHKRHLTWSRAQIAKIQELWETHCK